MTNITGDQSPNTDTSSFAELCQPTEFGRIIEPSSKKPIEGDPPALPDPLLFYLTLQQGKKDADEELFDLSPQSFDQAFKMAVESENLGLPFAFHVIYTLQNLDFFERALQMSAELTHLALELNDLDTLRGIWLILPKLGYDGDGIGVKALALRHQVETAVPEVIVSSVQGRKKDKVNFSGLKKNCCNEPYCGPIDYKDFLESMLNKQASGDTSGLREEILMYLMLREGLYVVCFGLDDLSLWFHEQAFKLAVQTDALGPEYAFEVLPPVLIFSFDDSALQMCNELAQLALKKSDVHTLRRLIQILPYVGDKREQTNLEALALKDCIESKAPAVLRKTKKSRVKNYYLG